MSRENRSYDNLPAITAFERSLDAVPPDLDRHIVSVPMARPSLALEGATAAIAW